MIRNTLFKLTATLALLATAAPAHADTIVCESRDNTNQYCRADTRGGVTLVHQRSKAGCWQDDTWGYDRGGIWVANGCRAEFRTGYSGSERRGSYYHNENRWDERDRDDHDDAKKAVGAALAIGLVAAAAAAASHHDDDDDYGRGHHDRVQRSVYKCESRNDRHHYCGLGGRTHHVELKRQLSDASCRYNRSWGYDRSGIWVSDGCRAEFWVE